MDKALKLEQLIDGAEELLTKLADAHDPQIQRLRDRVDAAIHDARGAFVQTADTLQIRDIATAVDEYVRDYPWIAVGAGILVAGTAGFLAGAAIGAKKR